MEHSVRNIRGEWKRAPPPPPPPPEAVVPKGATVAQLVPPVPTAAPTAADSVTHERTARERADGLMQQKQEPR